jgi:hypothetical protein
VRSSGDPSTLEPFSKEPYHRDDPLRFSPHHGPYLMVELDKEENEGRSLENAGAGRPSDWRLDRVFTTSSQGAQPVCAAEEGCTYGSGSYVFVRFSAEPPHFEGLHLIECFVYHPSASATARTLCGMLLNRFGKVSSGIGSQNFVSTSPEVSRMWEGPLARNTRNFREKSYEDLGYDPGLYMVFHPAIPGMVQVVGFGVWDCPRLDRGRSWPHWMYMPI